MKTGADPFFRYFPVSGRDMNWGLYATAAGETRIAAHTVYPPGGHPKGFAFDWQHGRRLEGFALIYISSGGGSFESEHSLSAAVEPGHAFLLFPGVWHRYRPAPETGWHEHWICFDGETARNWLRHRFISPKQPILKLNAEDTVLATFNRVMHSIRANRPALQQILGGATANLLGLYYSAQQARPAAESKNANVIEHAIARMEADYTPNLDVKAVAQELGVSYSWFRSTFAAHTGLSPHQYLLEWRLVRARNLLTETELSIKEIATETGFEDEHYFSRLFRQKLNLTPSAWRARSRRRK
jgi:AraC-like DNA-binding protein